MSSLLSPQVSKGSIVVLDPVNSNVINTITFQFNPETLTRTLQMQGASGEGGDRQEILRLKGPPIETIKLEVVIDASDQLELRRKKQDPPKMGIEPQLAQLEILLYPSSKDLRAANRLAQSGVLEILPAPAPLTLFSWGKNRMLPVRITEFSITEEAFDTTLNVIRAKVTLGLRVLSVNDLPFSSHANGLFMTYQEAKEKLARGEG